MPKRSIRSDDLRVEASRRAAMERLGAKLTMLIPRGAVDAAADAVGINRSTIYKWRSGAQQPGSVDLTLLANYLGVKLGDIVEDSPLPHTPNPYDTNEDYRSHIENLEVLSRDDRRAALRLVELAAAAASGRTDRAKTSQMPSRRRPSSPVGEEVETVEKVGDHPRRAPHLGGR